ncbi:MAG: response regulator transcription factor [Ilumatobacter sp.]|uniref:response regulator transcription factor n=1 Tax=Ilumatobacter sp. TaxID=1967498 RepID=UPI002614BD28|nr:response regulator transcription factor [Ilumatobacter sp.]MDJ0769938.1 response regulator transcription factor [Ilumatobacter sp.]
MPAGRRILIVEDDAEVRDAVARGLRLHDFEAVGARDTDAARAEIARRRPDLIVLDVGLPGQSGTEFCAQLRADGWDVPVLVLSARDAVGDRIVGLEAGADDYVVKPFDLQELVLRIEALLRRAPTTGDTDVVVAGALWIDVDRRLASVEGERIELSGREFDLLTALARNAGIVLSRVRLLELVWGYEFDVDTNVVDVFIGYLRRKLGAVESAPEIETVRGVGFVLRAS